MAGALLSGWQAARIETVASIRYLYMGNPLNESDSLLVAENNDTPKTVALITMTKNLKAYREGSQYWADAFTLIRLRHANDFDQSIAGLCSRQT